MATVAELEAQIEELKKLVGPSGKRGFKINGPRPVDEARKAILATRTGKPKTYRATQAGTDYKQGFIPAGKVFTTDMPQGSWMEEVKASDSKKSDD